MKKYLILSIALLSSLCTFHAQAATLSGRETTELRRALADYKKEIHKSRKEEEIINKYKHKYPNDPLVKDILEEKHQFDVSMQPSMATER